MCCLFERIPEPTTILTILFGFFLYQVFSSMHIYELILVIKLVTVGICMYSLYMLHDTEEESEETEETCKDDQSVRFIVRIRDEDEKGEGSIAEVKEMVESPAPSPVQETSTEFSDLLKKTT
jgi:hypothetical protein